MNFWGILGIFLILGLMFGGIYTSKMAAIREEAEKEKRRKIRMMRTDLVDIDELINTLLVYDRNPDLLTSMALHMEKIISDGLNLLPDSQDLKHDMAELEITKDRIEQLKATPEPSESPSTDRQLFLIKKHFLKTIKQLKLMHLTGQLTEIEVNTHRERLLRNALLLEVESYRLQSREAAKRGDNASAASFLKHAKDMLINSEVKFPEKTSKIQEVSREISNIYVTTPDEDESQTDAANS